MRVASDVARLFEAVMCPLRRAIEREMGRLPSEAEAFEAMIDHALMSWGAGRKKKYYAVLDRDDWRCVFPDCSSRKNLHVHHIRFRSNGGGDEPENLTTLCAFHHLRGVHGGTVRVKGTAPDGLLFELGLREGRKPLARYRSGAPPGRVVNQSTLSKRDGSGVSASTSDSFRSSRRSKSQLLCASKAQWSSRSRTTRIRSE
jgi:hypothetical protein